MRRHFRWQMFFGLGLVWLAGPAMAWADRQTISLDGVWQVAEGKLDGPPAKFDHTVPVPGLLDMATPRFESPGSTVSDKDRIRPWLRPADPRREAFWYRRTFKIEGPLRAVARLKVNKARYGTKVFLNGHVVGEHEPNFTPGWFDVRATLKSDGGENELVIRVGASLAQVPVYLTDGWDNEKARYIPGIYDSVELILCDEPYVVNVQTVPDVEKRSVRAVIELNTPMVAGLVPPAIARGTVREAKSGRVAGTTTGTANGNVVDLTIPIQEAHLWTPEDPFLYQLEVETGYPGDVTKRGDRCQTRFGLRSFSTDPAAGRMLLNGKPYFLRGSNVCIYRFEDAARGDLPWDRAWVRALHRLFKEMHWNSLRYCIGFPPERWYEIADEEGILIQDEFPVWYSRASNGWPKGITADHLAVEYGEWMRERWNHPCVMIWDAQNETANDRITAAALMKVRDLDLSRRPWDNGWGTPQRPNDICECHPYRSDRPGFTLAWFAHDKGIPDIRPLKGARPPYVINEYGWLWINRDGSLPTLTRDIYRRVLGASASPEDRFRYYARMLAAKTEFWRVRRKCAGVLHFCGLGYSRPDGQTSDNFIDVKNLVLEPNFHRYVRDAFAPVGVAIDFWDEEAEPGAKRRVIVRVINDLDTPWNGDVTLRLLGDGRTLLEEKKPVGAAALELGAAEFDVTFPAEPAKCQLVAEIRGSDGRPVQSLRDVRVGKAK